MKQITITPENLHRQKLSSVLESVKRDVNRVLKAGMKIYMGSYIDSKHVGMYNYNSKVKDCTACLGGVAVLGFMPKFSRDVLDDASRVILHGFDYTKLNGYKLTPRVAERLKAMAHMFDAFRRGEASRFRELWNEISTVEKNMIAYDTEGWGKIRDIMAWFCISGTLVSEEINELMDTIDQCVIVLRNHKL